MNGSTMTATEINKHEAYLYRNDGTQTEELRDKTSIEMLNERLATIERCLSGFLGSASYSLCRIDGMSTPADPAQCANAALTPPSGLSMPEALNRAEGILRLCEEMSAAILPRLNAI